MKYIGMNFSIVLSSILFCSLLFADEKWESASAGPLVTWTAPLCEKGKWAVQPYLIYNQTRGTFGTQGGYHSFPSGDSKNQYQQILFSQFGLTEKWEIAGQLVYQQNEIKQSGVRANEHGLGDSLLFLRRCVLEEGGKRPALTGVAQVKIPTGKYEHADPNKLGADLMGAGTGGGSWDPGLGFILSKTLKPFLLHADASYSVPLRAKVDGVNTTYGQYLNFDAGIEYFLPKGFNLMVEANGIQQDNIKEESRRVRSSGVDSFIVATGFGWSSEKIQTLLGYQRVVAGKNTDANDSVVLTAIFSF